MIYPTDNVTKFLHRYPALKEALPLCDCDVTMRPYRTSKSVGVECPVCESAVWTRTKREDNQRMLELLSFLPFERKGVDAAAAQAGLYGRRGV